MHGGIPPGFGFGSPVASAGAYLGSTGFWITAATLALVLAAGRWMISSFVARRCEVSPNAVSVALTPFLWGAATPSIAPVLDAFFFWPTAPPLAALGLTVGGLLVVRRWGALVPAPAESGVGLRSLLAGGTAIVALVLVIGWSPPSGDEPHYLIVTHSLVADGDLDLAEDYRRRVHAPYHPAALSPHYKPGLAEGTRYSMHGLGLSVLIAPAYAVGQRLGPEAMVALPRALLALLYGLFAWMLYGFIEETVSWRAAAYGTAATTLLAPLLFAPLFIFPEVPAMVLALFAFRGLTRTSQQPPVEESGLGVGRDPSAARDAPEIWCGLALAALPWLGVKYMPLAGTVFLVGIWCAAPAGRVGRACRSGAPLAGGFLLHALFTWALYGSISPLAVYLGAGPQAGAPALGGDWRAYIDAWPGAVATAIGYLLDQKDGLLAYGPHFLLAIVGLGLLWRRRRSLVVISALVVGSYVGPYALSQQLGGQGPPVRPLMAVLWVLGPALGAGLALITTARGYAALRGGLLALSTMLTLAYAAQPQLLPHDYPVLASRLLQNYTPYGSGWWRLFPQWVNVEQPNWAVTSVWTSVTVVLGVFLWRYGMRAADAAIVATTPPAPEPAADAEPMGDLTTSGTPAPIRLAGWKAATAVVVGSCAFVLVHHGAWPRTDRHRPTTMDAGPVVWVVEELPEVAWAEAGGVWATPGTVVDFVLTTREPLDTLEVSLRVLVPGDVAASVQGATFGGPAEPGANQRARLEIGRGRRDGDGYAYHGRLFATRGVAPADLLGGADERHLGVFFEIR